MPNHRTLIRDATVVFPDQSATTNVLIEGGKIVAVDAARDHTADEVVEAAGMILLPGAIDSHVHFREPGMTHKEDIETGSIACAAGGVTTFLEMPNTKPPAISVEAVQWKYRRAAEVSRVNFGFYIGATLQNLAELQSARNIPGIKIFIGSSTGDLLVDDQETLERIFAETTLPICAHCEDETRVRENRRRLGDTLSVHDHSRIRDAEAARIATARAVDLARRHQHRFHVLHISTAAEVPLVQEGHPWTTGEVCPHHLFFSVEDYDRLGTLIQINPAVKTKADNAALWEALLRRDLQAVVTDHAPHTWDEKQLPYPESPSGMPGVENCLALLLDQYAQGKCTLQDIAHWTADAPARVWGLVGKGRIAPGYDADLVLVNPELKRTILHETQYTKAKWSAWAGTTLTGWPVRTWVNGQLVYADRRVAASVRGAAVRCDHARGGYWATPDGIGI